MNRRGIALLATLWLIAALSVVAAGALTLARMERDTAIGRVALARGRYAADACLAILQGELARGVPLADVDSTDLGAGIWCRASIEDLGERLSVEVENADALALLVGDPERTASLLDWVDPDDAPRAGGAEGGWYRAHGLPLPRNAPLVDVAELRRIRGFDSAAVAGLVPYLSRWHSTRLNVNTAPRVLLATLQGLEPGAVDLIVAHRARGEDLRDLDAMLAALPASLRAPAMSRYAELQGRVLFSTERLLVHLEGGVPEVSFTVRATLLAQHATGRLAILAREEW